MTELEGKTFLQSNTRVKYDFFRRMVIDVCPSNIFEASADRFERGMTPEAGSM